MYKMSNYVRIKWLLIKHGLMWIMWFTKQKAWKESNKKNEFELKNPAHTKEKIWKKVIMSNKNERKMFIYTVFRFIFSTRKCPDIFVYVTCEGLCTFK